MTHGALVRMIMWFRAKELQRFDDVRFCLDGRWKRNYELLCFHITSRDVRRR